MTTIKIVQSAKVLVSGKKQIELYIDGYFEASWNDLDSELSSDDRVKIVNMIRLGVSHGEDLMKKKVRALLGCN